jgi:hypothetical protein
LAKSLSATAKIGSILIDKAGIVQISVRPAGAKMAGAGLMNLRTLVLTQVSTRLK